jgi:hypothetical protein
MPDQMFILPLEYHQARNGIIAIFEVLGLGEFRQDERVGRTTP